LITISFTKTEKPSNKTPQIIVLKTLILSKLSNVNYILLFVQLIFLCGSAYAQSKLSKTYPMIREHLEFLASDSLQGRRAGSPGEQKAAVYIAEYFKSLNLGTYRSSPSYFQPFEFPDGFKISETSKFEINRTPLVPMVDYYPMSFSSHTSNLNDDIYPSLKETQQFWMLDIVDHLNKAASNPHSDILSELRTLSINSQLKGAIGLIFYTSGNTELLPQAHTKFTETLSIPVFILKKYDLIKSIVKNSNPLRIYIDFHLEKKSRYSKNVIGFLDNNKQETILIGAHFDHLGFGEDGNSMIGNPVNQIHNGADDNASGTVTMMNLAKLLKVRRFNHYNFLFVAFSAEELGLIGSKYFAEHHDFKSHPLKYMINLDMVGRFNDSSRSFTIGGFGTSKEWSIIFNQTKSKDYTIKFDSSGTGPSDHTSFYRKDVPVLFYFTGLHSDYHKPTDDPEKINYGGINFISDNILQVVKKSKSFALPFAKTREIQTSTSTRFSVSLGIMPDYSYTGNGVRVDGVSEGKLAQQIGMQSSDIIKKLGSIDINSVESYMKALAQFKKGDTTFLEYQRGNDVIKIQITFK